MAELPPYQIPMLDNKASDYYTRLQEQKKAFIADPNSIVGENLQNFAAAIINSDGLIIDYNSLQRSLLLAKNASYQVERTKTLNKNPNSVASAPNKDFLFCRKCFRLKSTHFSFSSIVSPSAAKNHFVSCEWKIEVETGDNQSDKALAQTDGGGLTPNHFLPGKYFIDLDQSGSIVLDDNKNLFLNDKGGLYTDMLRYFDSRMPQLAFDMKNVPYETRVTIQKMNDQGVVISNMLAKKATPIWTWDRLYGEWKDTLSNEDLALLHEEEITEPMVEGND